MEVWSCDVGEKGPQVEGVEGVKVRLCELASSVLQ